MKKKNTEDKGFVEKKVIEPKQLTKETKEVKKQESTKIVQSNVSTKTKKTDESIKRQDTTKPEIQKTAKPDIIINNEKINTLVEKEPEIDSSALELPKKLKSDSVQKLKINESEKQLNFLEQLKYNFTKGGSSKSYIILASIIILPLLLIIVILNMIASVKKRKKPSLNTGNMSYTFDYVEAEEDVSGLSAQDIIVKDIDVDEMDSSKSLEYEIEDDIDEPEPVIIQEEQEEFFEEDFEEDVINDNVFEQIEENLNEEPEIEQANLLENDTTPPWHGVLEQQETNDGKNKQEHNEESGTVSLNDEEKKKEELFEEDFEQYEKEVPWLNIEKSELHEEEQIEENAESVIKTLNNSNDILNVDFSIQDNPNVEQFDPFEKNVPAIDSDEVVLEEDQLVNKENEIIDMPLIEEEVEEENTETISEESVSDAVISEEDLNTVENSLDETYDIPLVEEQRDQSEIDYRVELKGDASLNLFYKNPEESSSFEEPASMLHMLNERTEQDQKEKEFYQENADIDYKDVKEEEIEVIAQSEINKHAKLYIINIDDKNTLIGDVDSNITILETFKHKVNNPLISVRLTEKRDEQDVYMVRINKWRALVGISDEKAELLLVL